MATLDEDDFSLIHALQIRPRATWTDLAAALGTSPTTLSRRWERLRADGSAWVIGHPRVRGHHGASLAIAEISCVSGRTGTLAQELAEWPMIITIEEAARDYGLIVTAVGLGPGDMPKLLLDDLSALPGVLGVRAHHVARLHLDASSWRVGGLDHERAQAVARIPDHGGGPSTPVNPWAEPYAGITQALIKNGRSSAADIARQTGRPLSTSRRQLGQLLASDSLTFRCEVAQGLTPLPIVVQTWCQVPVGAVAECVSRLRTTPGVRQVVGLPGPTNLLISTWARSAESAMLLHEHLQRDLALKVVESAIILRQIKRLGWRLDELGRATGPLVPYPPNASV
ncbi:Lrp/AsnC family transcriptional regulator [Nocardioides sp. CCNWLW239]|uniref:Lrp/AsnC family transcriptional regulator n=1 Tax=Nocardioides sp. CCNWLW239 TaxID=3128902 RepID=UPI0030191D2D